NHLLTGSNVKKMAKSPNHSGKFEKGDMDTVIMHYTAGPYKTALRTLVNPRVRASAHVIIDRDGTITQLIPFDVIAWHAGRSYYKGRSGFNKYSLGVEMVNSGYLSKSGNIYRAWYGEAFNPSEVIESVHRNQTRPKYWHVYTPEQIDAAYDLVQLFIDTYGIKVILGHEEIAPKRKTDPGPAFPLNKFRERLLGTSRDSDGPEIMPDSGRIIANSLNIRSKPDTNGIVVAKPLRKGTKVTILDEHNGWYKVTVNITGWVYGKYVEFT
ncbi:MAG: N-acetylmuramoyl-L-alanine amidase, partial [Bacteroidota bacterium]|nr:N-acetylmuramoyl-L-alanine amidase [Bacteroidota bacterium]